MWNSQDTAHVPQSIGKMVKLKLIENFKQVWRESFLTPLNVSIIEYLKQT